MSFAKIVVRSIFQQELYQKFLHGEVVVFAGAGISTESGQVFPYSFYEDVRGEVGNNTKTPPSFPDLMTEYCAQPNGRARLLRKISDRFAYIKSFPELYRTATHFHNELATIANIENIITTNWDTYFEDECGAIPFVDPRDFVFWSMPGRKIFKIHGSVASYGSLAATREDYELCYQRLSTGIIGSNLRMMLATKTLVYVGFSFLDDDFLRIHAALTSEMGELLPQSYIVTVDDSSDLRFRAANLIPIYTAGAFFLQQLKQRLVKDGQMLADSRFAGVSTIHSKVVTEHHRVSEIDIHKYPDVIYTLAHQDGMIHALERIEALRKTGYYSHRCNISNTMLGYEKKLLPEKRRQRKYEDIAYIEGYMDGHLYLLADNKLRRMFPFYFVFDSGFRTNDFRTLVAQLRKANASRTASHRYACRLVKKAGVSSDMVIHHTPFLL